MYSTTELLSGIYNILEIAKFCKDQPKKCIFHSIFFSIIARQEQEVGAYML